MRIGLLLPSIFGANRYLKGRIFAPLSPAVALADKLVEKGHEVFFYGSRDVQTKAQIVPGDWELTDSDPFYFLFRNRDPQEQKYSTMEIIKRDFEYDLTMRAYDDAVNKKKLDIIHSYHDFGAHYFNELTHFPTVYTLHDPLPQVKDTIEYHRLSKFPNHNYVSISDSQRKGIVNLNFAGTVYHGL
jgi:UDP:flavonoid glycosyltransferase YjiC (YdhE family)